MGGSAVAQPHQRDLLTIGQFAGYVGELAPEAHVDLSQLGPAGLGVPAKPLGQGEWKFTPTDLEDLLARIERHEHEEQNQQHKHDHQPAARAAA